MHSPSSSRLSAREAGKDSSPAYLTADARHRITEASSSFVSEWGYASREQIEGRSLDEFWGFPAGQSAADFVADHPSGWRGTMLSARKNGHVFQPRVSFQPLGKPADGYRGCRILVEDGEPSTEKAVNGRSDYSQKLRAFSEWSIRLRGEPVDIFEDVVGLLGKLFGTRAASICRIDGNVFFSKAMYADGAVHYGRFETELSTAPCASVVESQQPRIFNNVTKCYPEAPLLQRFDAVFYCGVPVQDYAGNVVAVICLVDDKARLFCTEDMELLRLTADRVSWELERERTMNKQRDAEESARAIERLTTATFDAIDFQVLVLDEDGRVLLANRKSKEFVASCPYSWRSPSVGANFLRLCQLAANGGSTPAAEIAEGVEGILRHGQQNFAVSYRCDWDGGWYLCRGLRFQAIDATRVLIVQSDITMIKRMEEQTSELRAELLHAQRVSSMGEIASGIAHELNQPLAAITLYAEGYQHFLEQGDTNFDSLECVTKIAALSHRCGSIISNLRRVFSRDTAYDEVIDLREVVAAVVSIFQHQWIVRNIPCRTHMACHPVLIRGDAVQMQQIVLNLLQNAVESHAGIKAEDCRIDIHLHANEREMAELVIEDRGGGLSSDAQDRLFEPFFTTREGGMGMGLKISQSIVRAHGGSIQALPRRGRGSRFIVTVPLAVERAEDEE